MRLPSSRPVVLYALSILLCGCREEPTTPEVAAPVTVAQGPAPAFTFTGNVADETGAPLRGIPVLMRYYTAPGQLATSTDTTDAAGSYSVAFTSKPYTGLHGSYAARAELVTSDYEWLLRDVPATGPRRVENFSLHRPVVVAAGGSAVLTLTPDECLGWVGAPCGLARVRTTGPGTFALSALVGGALAAQLDIQACCDAGGEWVSGNPVVVKATGGTEWTVQIGYKAPGSSTVAQVTLQVR